MNVNDELSVIAAELNGDTTEEAQQESIDTGEVENEILETLPEDESTITDTQEGEQEEGEESEIKSLNQLAEAIEVDTEFLYGIEIAMADGGDAVPIGEIKDKFQNLNREKTALETQLQQQEEQLKLAQSGVMQNQSMSNDLMLAMGEANDIARQYNEVDWATYEEQDPGAAALARQKFQEANTVAQQRIKQVQMQQSQQQQAAINEGYQTILKTIPEWNNEEVREKERGELHQMLLAEGYQENEISLESNPIATRLARELMQYRAKDEAAQAAVKRVRNAPQVLKRGGNIPKAKDATAQLVSKAKNTGSKQDRLNAVKSILGGAA